MIQWREGSSTQYIKLVIACSQKVDQKEEDDGHYLSAHQNKIKIKNKATLSTHCTKMLTMFHVQPKNISLCRYVFFYRFIWMTHLNSQHF